MEPALNGAESLAANHGPLFQVPPLDPRIDANTITASSAATTLIARLTSDTGPRLLALSGAAGLGKTTVLIAIAHNPILRNLYLGGIAFLPLHPSRRNALPTALKSIFPYMPRPPTQRLQALNFAERVNEITQRFLVIADDLPTRETLSCLRLILRDAQRVTVLFATRDHSLANLANHTTVLEPMSPLSTTSFSLFAAWAGLPPDHSIDPREEAPLGILTRCSGRPLLLGLAGRSVAKMGAFDSGPSWRAVLATYYAKLQCAEAAFVTPQSRNINPEMSTAAPILHVCMDLLQRELEGDAIDDIPAIFRRFCVVPRPGEVSTALFEKICMSVPSEKVEVLKQQLYSFGLLMDRSTSNDKRHAIHDVVLDWVEAEARANDEYINAHRLILRSFMTSLSGESPLLAREVADRLLVETGSSGDDVPHILNRGSVEAGTREWWKVLDHLNSAFLSRHLSTFIVRAQCLPELVGLLTRAEWTSVHVARNELSELRNDFQVCLNALSDDHEETRVALNLIRNAIEDMWVLVRDAPHEIRTQSAAMLSGLSDSWLVERFISKKTNVEKMWLRPRHRFVAQPSGATHGTYTLSSLPDALGVDWKKREIIAAFSNGHVMEIDTSTRYAAPSWVPRHPSRLYRGRLGVHSIDETTENLVCLEIIPDDGSSSTLISEDLQRSIVVINRSERYMVWDCNILSRGRILFAIGAGRLAVSTIEGGITVLDMLTGSTIADMFDFCDPSILPTSLALSERTVIVGTSVGMILLCGIQEQGIRGVIEGHDGSVETIATDSGILLTGGSDGSLKWWSEESGTLQHCVENAHVGGVRCIAFATDTDVVVSGGVDGAVRWWSSRDGSMLGATQTGGAVLTHIAIRPDGEAIAVCGLDRVVRWGEGVGRYALFDDSQWANSGELGKRAFESAVVALDISMDKRVIAGLDDHGMIRLWKDGEILWERSNIRHMALAADGRSLLIGNEMQRDHEILDIDSTESRLRISESSFLVPLIANDASNMVMMRGNGSADVRNAQGDLLMVVTPATTIRPIALVGSNACERAISAEADGTLTWWDLSLGEASQLGDHMEKDGNARDDNNNRGDGSSETQADEDNEKWGTTCLAMSAGGSTAIVGHLNGWLQYWKWRTKKATWTGKGHDGRVSGVSLSANGKCAVTGGSDSMVIIWEVSAGVMKIIRKVHMPAAVTSVRLGANSDMCVVGDVTGAVWTFDLLGGDSSMDELY